MPIFKLLARFSEPPNRQLKKSSGSRGDVCQGEPPNRQLKKTITCWVQATTGEPPNRQLILGLEASNGNDTHRRKAAIVLNPPRFLGGFFLLCYVNSIGEDELVCLRAPAGVIMNTHFT